jgi:SM-20-related protein
MFRLNPALDRAALTAAFRAQGRIQIGDFLDGDAAAALHRALRERDDWKQIVNSGDKIFELDRKARSEMSAEQLDAFDQVVFAAARDGFQHRYEAIRVPDESGEREASDDILAKFALWLSGGEPRELVREIAGDPAIDFADAQATAYAPGDFLTAHDDAVAGKNRSAAYVFGLTPRWRVEWGGLLLFHSPRGDISHGMTPRFNTLTLFAVPQLHSVSMVTKSAAFRRYSITGWLRSR